MPRAKIIQKLDYLESKLRGEKAPAAELASETVARINKELNLATQEAIMQKALRITAEHRLRLLEELLFKQLTELQRRDLSDVKTHQLIQGIYTGIKLLHEIASPSEVKAAQEDEVEKLKNLIGC